MACIVHVRRLGGEEPVETGYCDMDKLQAQMDLLYHRYEKKEDRYLIESYRDGEFIMGGRTSSLADYSLDDWDQFVENMTEVFDRLHSSYVGTVRNDTVMWRKQEV